jgi:hypothetical protein
VRGCIPCEDVSENTPATLGTGIDCVCILKGTGSPDGLGFSWHIWIDLGLKKGRGWFLNFLGAPSIIHRILVLIVVNAIVSWLIKLAAYFCQSLLITGRYCSMIKVDWLTAGVLQIIPANGKLGLEADEISQTLLTNRMQRNYRTTIDNGGAPEIICQDSLAGWWCTADLGRINIGQLQVPAGVPQTKHQIQYRLQTLRQFDINTDQSGVTLK